MRAHFICRGNAYRSRMAEAYLNSLELEDIRAYSSGTVAEERSEYTRPIAANTLKFLGEKGLSDYAKPDWDQLTQQRIDYGDITVCMNLIVREECEQKFILPPGTITWEIDDSDEGGRVLTTEEEWWNYTEELFQRIKKTTDELVRQTVGLQLPSASE